MAFLVIHLAIRRARTSDHTLYQHGCVVVKNGRVLAAEANRNWRHAEVRALSKIKGKKENLTLWSVRIKKDGRIGNAKPCAKCRTFLVENGVRKLFYSNERGEIVKEEW
jgi:pyrimidine deaminase RibD-like protein